MRGHEKSIQRRRLPKKGGLKTVCQFKGGGGAWQEKGGGVFEAALEFQLKSHWQNNC